MEKKINTEGMTLAQMREVRNLADLPEAIAGRILEKLAADAGLVVNTATRIRLVSPDGRKIFYAQRHSDRRTGASTWSISYSRKVWGIRKDVIGYKFDVYERCFSRTADGTGIPKALPYKKDVIELLKHIDWCRDLI